jgi:hypothetical protein
LSRIGHRADVARRAALDPLRNRTGGLTRLTHVPLGTNRSRFGWTVTPLPGRRCCKRSTHSPEPKHPESVFLMYLAKSRVLAEHRVLVAVKERPMTDTKKLSDKQTLKTKAGNDEYNPVNMAGKKAEGLKANGKQNTEEHVEPDGGVDKNSVRRVQSPQRK